MEKQEVQVVHLQMVREKQIPYKGKSMKDPREAAALAKNFIGAINKECVVVCAVDIKMKPTYIQMVGMGTVNCCPVFVSEIFKAALLSNATGIVLFHNHISGDCTPSNEDILLTERVLRSSKLLGIQFMDHIILGDGNFYSLRESGRLSGWGSSS